MSLVVQENTQVVLPFGPFLDVSDGKTPLTLLGSQTGSIWIPGGGGGAMIPTAWSHHSDGHYNVTVQAAYFNSGTGMYRIWFDDVTTYLPVWSDIECVTSEEFSRRFGTGQNVSDVVDGVLDASVSAHVVAGSVGRYISDTHDRTLRSLGLSKENMYLDNVQNDSQGRMTSARVRTFSTYPFDPAVDLPIATYALTITYSGAGVATWKMERV